MGRTDNLFIQSPMRFAVKRSRPGVSTTMNLMPPILMRRYRFSHPPSSITMGSTSRVHGSCRSLSIARFLLPIPDRSLLANYQGGNQLPETDFGSGTHIALPRANITNDTGEREVRMPWNGVNEHAPSQYQNIFFHVPDKGSGRGWVVSQRHVAV